uniref:Uncharacterized protein n=1 Tax=Arundo donax TaxID=35708 RepID=A0A0A9H608_ARUDO
MPLQFRARIALSACTNRVQVSKITTRQAQLSHIHLFKIHQVPLLNRNKNISGNQGPKELKDVN